MKLPKEVNKQSEAHDPAKLHQQQEDGAATRVEKKYTHLPKLGKRRRSESQSSVEVVHEERHQYSDSEDELVIIEPEAHETAPKRRRSKRDASKLAAKKIGTQSRLENYLFPDEDENLSE